MRPVPPRRPDARLKGAPHAQEPRLGPRRAGRARRDPGHRRVGPEGPDQNRVHRLAHGTVRAQWQGHGQRLRDVPGRAQIPAGRPRGEADHRRRRGQAGHRADEGARVGGESERPRHRRPDQRRHRLRDRTLRRRQEGPDHLSDRVVRGHHAAQAQQLHRPHGLVELAAVASLRQVGVREPQVPEDRDHRVRLRVRLGGRRWLPPHVRGGGRAGRAEAVVADQHARLRAVPGPAPARRRRRVLRVLGCRCAALLEAIRRCWPQGAHPADRRRYLYRRARAAHHG